MNASIQLKFLLIRCGFSPNELTKKFAWLWIITYYLIALSIIPWIKYFCKNRNAITTGKIEIIAAAAAEFKSLYVCEKKEAIDKVAVFISVACKIYLENW